MITSIKQVNAGPSVSHRKNRAREGAFLNRSASKRRPNGGFTLVEVAITAALLSLVVAMMVPTFTFFARTVVRLGNYSSMSQNSRVSLEILSRDLHMASALILAKEDELTVELPVDAGGHVVHYLFDKSSKTVKRTVRSPGGGEVSRDLLTDVSEFSLRYYNRLGVELAYSHAPLLDEAKSVMVNSRLLKRVVGSDTSDYIISARFLMRNR